MIKMKNVAVAIGLCAFLVTSVMTGTCHALKINIDPPRVEVTIKPGEEKSGFVAVQNYDTDGTVHMKAYVQDLVYLPDGSNDFLEPGSTPWTLGDNIKIGPTEFDIAPGKQEMVRYVITMPKDAKGGRYGVIFFEVAVPPSQYEKVGASINVRLGSVVLATAEGTDNVKVKVMNMSVDPVTEKKPMTINCNVFNEGNVIARPSGTAKIIDENKTQIAEIPMNKEKGGVLPGTSRVYSAEYKEALKPGNYFVQVVLDYGGDAYLGGQTKFKVE